MFFKKKETQETKIKSTLSDLETDDVIILKDFQSLDESDSGVEYTVLNHYQVRTEMGSHSQQDATFSDSPQTPESNTQLYLDLWELDDGESVYLMTLQDDILRFYFIPMEPVNRQNFVQSGNMWLLNTQGVRCADWEFLQQIDPPPFEELGAEIEATYISSSPTIFATIKEDKDQYMACQIKLYTSKDEILNKEFMVWEQHWLDSHTGQSRNEGGLLVVAIGCIIASNEYELYFK